MMKSVEYLKSKGIKFRLIHLKEIPRTAKDVERIYGCPLRNVLKTLVFIGASPLIAVLPGNKKASVGKLEIGSGIAETGIEMSGEELRKAWDGMIADIAK